MWPPPSRRQVKREGLECFNPQQHPPPKPVSGAEREMRRLTRTKTSVSTFFPSVPSRVPLPAAVLPQPLSVRVVSSEKLCPHAPAAPLWVLDRGHSCSPLLKSPPKRREHFPCSPCCPTVSWEAGSPRCALPGSSRASAKTFPSRGHFSPSFL